MVGKSVSECISIIENNLAALKSLSGEPDGDDADEMEMAERPVGRGRQRRPAPFFKKKSAESSQEDDE